MSTDPTAYFPLPSGDHELQRNLDLQEDFERERQEYFESRTLRDLDAMGVPPRLRKATFPGVPDEIFHACDSKHVNLRDFPGDNFGFVGPGGSGKSSALVWAIKSCLFKLYEKAGPATCGAPFVKKQGEMEGSVMRVPVLDLEFKWIGWPAAATRMKNLASQRKWEEPESSILPLCKWLKADPSRRVLIVDDIGMENIGNYTSEQLELLIDTVYNHEGKFFWTSEWVTASKDENEKTLRKLYSYRLVSRLIGLAPMIQLPTDMPDLRVRP